MALTLSGCFSSGKAVRIPVDMGSGVHKTIVAHNRVVPEYLIADGKRSLDFIYEGELTQTQLTAIAGAEKACRIYTGTVHPNQLVAVLMSGVLYGAAGFVGAGAGSQVWVGAKFVEYGAYGGAAGALGGIANGIITLGGRNYTFQNCGRELFGDEPQFKIKVLISSPY